MDKIIIKQMQFYGYHGVLPEENRLGQRFIVDLELYVSLKRAARTDKVEDTVNYAEVYEITKNIVEGPSKKLIESVAETISDTLLKSFPAIQHCKVILIKPDPPIHGHYHSVAVEITRGRNHE